MTPSNPIINHSAPAVEESWTQSVSRALAPLTPKRQRKARAPEIDEAIERAARRAAVAGLGKAALAPKLTPELATALLEDMMPHPEHSRAREPRLPANLLWIEKANKAAKKLSEAFNDPSLQQNEARAGLVAAGFAKARMAVLAELGADPLAANTLARAAFRGSVEETIAALSMPGCPSPATAVGRGASALHRAAYDGSDEIFAILAQASSPMDWLCEDAGGRVPFAKALQGRARGRAKAAFELTPWALGARTPTPLSDAAGEFINENSAPQIIAGPAWTLGVELCLSHPATAEGAMLRADGSSFVFALRHFLHVVARLEAQEIERSIAPAAPQSSRPRI
jgi:hypothetical protein